MTAQGPAGAKVQAFISQFPAELADCRRFSSSDLHQRFAFVQRMLDSGLPNEFRVSHRLSFAERLPLPFCRDAQIWRFVFEPVEKESDGAKTIEALSFQVTGNLIPVDYTDACFAAAMAADQGRLNLDSDGLKQAHLAVYFAASRRVREQDFFYPSFRSLACPEGVDTERWKAAQEEAGRFAAQLSQKDLYLRINRRDGQISVFSHPSPSERLILDDPALIVEHRPSLFVWGLTPDPLLSRLSKDRRTERDKDAEIAIRKYRRWRPEDFSGAEIADVTEKARTLYAERRQLFSWLQIFPPAVEEDAQRQPLLREAEEFFRAINDRCEDYTIPQDCLASSGKAEKTVVTVQRRALPFYPGHRLYKILDRRGGRPRQTQILFAPREAEIPEGLDRLIPLNDESDTQHMLNSIYKPHLTGLEAIEYLDFFCDALSGGDGAFHVVETAEDVRWRGQAPEQLRIVKEVVTPIRLWSAMDANPLILDAVLTYAGTLFHAEFKVDPSGSVEMLNDQPLFERLEIAPELFSARTHFFLRSPRDFIAPPDWRAKALRQ
jgi:hypothetical protein